jgi:hypothetical protein
VAKLVFIYENGLEKRELTFKGEAYDYTMLPTEHGRQGDKPCFDTQFKKAYPGAEEDLLAILDDLSFVDDADDILDLLEELEEFE